MKCERVQVCPQVADDKELMVVSFRSYRKGTMITVTETIHIYNNA
jgi:hypothetical protein